MTNLKQKKDFLEKVFKNNVNYARDGVNAAVVCPFCKTNKSQKKKLSIHLETELCHCWVCGFKSKSLIPVLKKKQVPHAYREKYKKIFKKILDDKVLKEEEKISFDDHDLIHLFDPGVRSSDPDVSACLRYLSRRGVSKKSMWKFKICTSSKGQFKRRIIIPSFDNQGNLNYYTSRCIYNESKYKYVNAPAKKKDFIFNDLYIDWNRELAIVEGPFDYLKAGPNAACLLGSSLSEHHLLAKKIISNKTNVILCLDPDVMEKQVKIADMLCSFGVNVRMLKIDNTKYDDIGQMPEGYFESLLPNATQWSKTQSLYYKISEIRSGSLI